MKCDDWGLGVGVSLCRVWKVIYCCMFHISLALLHTLLNKCHYVDEWVKEEQKHKILERNTQQRGPVGTWLLEKQCKDADWIRLAQRSGPWRILHSTANRRGAEIFQKIWKQPKNVRRLEAEGQQAPRRGPTSIRRHFMTSVIRAT